MKKALKALALSTILAGVLALSGCKTTPIGEGEERDTLAGVYEVRHESFAPVGPTTFGVSSDEIVDRDAVTGTQVKLLWGLITFVDY